MPWLNALAKKYAYASAYYANTHPSIGNYFELTTGKIITNNDAYKTKVTADNIVRHLLSAGKTWKEYTEGLPSVGYTGGDTGEYTQHHNPLSYFSDVRNSSNEKINLVPFSQFPKDLRNGSLPSYSFIVPDNDNNGHDCPATIPNCTDSQRLAHVDGQRAVLLTIQKAGNASTLDIISGIKSMLPDVQKTLPADRELKSFRSVFLDGKPPRLLINGRLMPSQKGFLLAREIGYDVLRLLEEFPSCSLNIFEFLRVAQPLRPRYYSASSSPRVHGEGVVQVTAGLEPTPVPGGHPFRGLGSHYLHALRPGDRLNVFLDSADGFRLQQDVTRPMIFVSAGTGLAPMRGFCWERLAMQRSGVTLAEAAAIAVPATRTLASGEVKPVWETPGSVLEPTYEV